MLQPSDIQKSGILDFPAIPVSDDLPSKIKGNNRKGLVIVSAEAENPELELFLTKILQAVQLQAAEDTCQISLDPNQQLWMSGLQEKIPFAQLISFGVPPAKLGYNLLAPPYQPFSFCGKTLLFAHSLSKIMQNPELKKPLWEALKKMFA
ncbi:MAG: hypothetical protein RI973_633 [Bacteroidota bacterium]|jgi:DNA polymerase III psi subunit